MNEYIRIIVLRLAKYKWLVLAGGFLFAAALFLYAKSIPATYTAKATVFPLTASNENPTSSAISTLLGGADATRSFSSDASINIVELALSRNTMEAVVLKRLPQFENKRVAELLIESYNRSRKPWVPALKIPSDTLLLKATGSSLLKESYSAKVLKSGILEVTFSNANKDLLSPVSYALIDKISQFYIDLKIKKAKKDYDFTLQKVDSLQAILNVYDRQAVRMSNTTLFVPNSRIEYSIPKENLVNAKERVMRQRDASANNREEALWRLQKATPIIATLDKPEPPFDKKSTSKVIYAFIGFVLGMFLTMGILLAPLISKYIKEEANKAIFGDDNPFEEKKESDTVSTTL
jgi:uncharacterized protein involved in exopolysaccharide biosynthesis